MVWINCVDKECDDKMDVALSAVLDRESGALDEMN